MELSKEQINWLEKASIHEIPDGQETYNGNPILVGLIKLELISFDSDYQSEGYIPKNFRLTPKGELELSLLKERRYRWFAEHWIAPMVTGFISGVLVTVIATLLLGWLQLPK